MLLPRTLRFCQWVEHCDEERVPTSCDTATHEMLSEEASPDVVGVACAKLLSTAFSNSACSASDHNPACRASAQFIYTELSNACQGKPCSTAWRIRWRLGTLLLTLALVGVVDPLDDELVPAALGAPVGAART